MKKFIAIFLAVLFMLSLAACGGGEGTEDGGDDSVKVSRGVITGDAYKNTFAGFTFTKPEDWVYLSDEEIGNTIDAGQAGLDLNAIQETLAKKASVYDMAASNVAGESVMIIYENTMLTAFKKISADEYLTSVKTQLNGVSSVEYSFGKVEDITLGSTEYKKLTVEAESSGVTFIQAYYVRMVENYAVGVVVTTFSDESLANIEAMFS